MNKKFKEIFFSVMIAVLIFLIIVVAKIGTATATKEEIIEFFHDEME